MFIRIMLDSRDPLTYEVKKNYGKIFIESKQIYIPSTMSVHEFMDQVYTKEFKELLGIDQNEKVLGVFITSMNLV